MRLPFVCDASVQSMSISASRTRHGSLSYPLVLLQVAYLAFSHPVAHLGTRRMKLLADIWARGLHNVAAMCLRLDRPSVPPADGNAPTLPRGSVGLVFVAAVVEDSCRITSCKVAHHGTQKIYKSLQLRHVPRCLGQAAAPNARCGRLLGVISSVNIVLLLA